MLNMVSAGRFLVGRRLTDCGGGASPPAWGPEEPPGCRLSGQLWLSYSLGTNSGSQDPLLSDREQPALLHMAVV